MDTNRLTKVEALQIELYKVIEKQAMMQAQHNQLEQYKTDLAKQLGDARQAEANAGSKPKAPPSAADDRGNHPPAP